MTFLLPATGRATLVAMLLPVLHAVIPAPAAGADGVAAKKAEIEQIRTRISAVKKELDAMLGKRNKLQITINGGNSSS